jgi:hypothetical protein
MRSMFKAEQALDIVEKYFEAITELAFFLANWIDDGVRGQQLGEGGAQLGSHSFVAVRSDQLTDDVVVRVL